MSPSARKVWIEMYMLVRSRWKNGVTFRKEGVDWNNTVTCLGLTDIVTFRKEGVDWNHHCAGASDRYYVTFRKEGVDWNGIILAISPLMWSPSVRKVWIEIFVNSVIWYCTSSPSTRKVWMEIDRTTYIELLDTSPSARKMWIEIGEQGKWVFWVLRHILQMDPISQIW